MNRNLIIYIALAVYLLSSCNKSAEPSVTKITSSDTTFNLINNSNRPMNVDMYTSDADRGNQANVVFSCVVPAKGLYKIPFSKLDTNAIYYYDIYTADYRYSNWANSDNAVPLFYNGHFRQLDTFYFTEARYVYLNGNNSSVTWKAVNKYDWNNNSLWNTLNANEKYMRIAVNRNKKGSVNFKQSDGTPITLDIIQMNSYMYNGFSKVSFSMASSSADYSLYNTSILPDFNINHVTNHDTILLYDNFYSYWVMVKE